MDPVSPELALVDPELAAAAREALPDPVSEAPAERVPARRRRRRRPLAVAALLGASGLAAGALVVLAGRQDEQPAAAPTARVLGAQKAEHPPPKSLPTSVGPRVFTWEKTKGAVFYYVAFVHNGKPFHAARTRQPWLRIPNGVRFSPGTYRWSVQPAVEEDSGIVLRDAVLVRTFRVTRG